MKKILLIVGLITVPLLYVFDDNLLDIADFKCETSHNLIGYPRTFCSIAFDDKGIVAKVKERI